MRKRIIQKLTMLALIVMASIPAFAQGGKFGTNAGATTSVPPGKNVGDPFDYYELKYEVTQATGGMYIVKVIGFSEYAKNTPEMFDAGKDFDQTVTIPHWVNDGSTPFVVEAVAEGAFGTSAEGISDIASKVKKLVIDFKSDTESSGATQGIPVSIGANAFAGLTALTEVQNFTPGDKVLGFDDSVFEITRYTKASLVVPNDAILGYSGAEGWTNFMKMSDGAVIRGDVDGDGYVDDFDYACIIDLFLSNSYDPAYDLDGDGYVDDFDAAIAIEIFNAY